MSGVVCDYLYGRDVWSTGKFCAGGSVDACQVKICLLMLQDFYPIDYRRIQEVPWFARLRADTTWWGLLAVGKGEWYMMSESLQLRFVFF